MDTIKQIKNNLISRIKDSKDLKFLKAVQTLLDASERSLYQLSAEQQTSIELGRMDIENGNSSESRQVISEMKEWLTKK